MEGRIIPARPELAEQASQFMLLERAVEQEYRPLMLAELQRRVDAVAQTAQTKAPACPRCGQTMGRKDTRPVSWLARFGRLSAPVSRFVCRACHVQCRPLLDLLGVEPGRICGSLARLLALLAAVAPYSLAARLAWLLLGVDVNAMSVWRVAQRFRASGGGLRRGSQRVSCRQPQPDHREPGCAADRGAQCGWLRTGNAGARTEAPPQERGEAASPSRRSRRPFP